MSQKPVVAVFIFVLTLLLLGLFLGPFREVILPHRFHVSFNATNSSRSFNVSSEILVDIVVEKPRVFDCVVFNGEFDMLEMRMLTHTHIDFFHIVEANLTFSGKPKPLYLTDVLKAGTRPVLNAFAHKIIISNPRYGSHTPRSWDREHESREAFHYGLLGIARPNDWLLLSDIDEIVNMTAFQIALGENYTSVKFRCRFFYYNGGIDNRPGSYFGSPAMHRWNSTFNISMNKLFRKAEVAIPGTCWHCSYCFGPSLEDAIDQVINKLKSFSHQEYNRPPFTNRDRICDAIINHRSVFDGIELKIVDPLEDLPLPIRTYRQFSYMMGIYYADPNRQNDCIPTGKNHMRLLAPVAAPNTTKKIKY